MVAADGDAHAVGIALLRADFANHFGVSDFFLSVGGDIFEADEEYDVSAIDAFTRSVRRGSDALAESAELV